MTTESPSAAIEFRNDLAERIVLGTLMIFVGVVALAFWNLERTVFGPMGLNLLIGVFFIGLGVLLIGFRRLVRLDPTVGVKKTLSLFGVEISRRNYPLVEFESVGSHGSGSEMLLLDVVLFKKSGGHLMLRSMLSDADAQRNVDEVARCLGIHAEFKPRTRRYLIAK